MTLTLALELPLTVRVKLPTAATPEPVRGMATGEEGSELVTVSVALRWPLAVGVKVTCAVQVAPTASVVAEHGMVTA